VDDQLTKDAKPKVGKKAQIIMALLFLGGPFLLTIYSLFEAYWTGEVLGCGRGHGCTWTSYQNSPTGFVVIAVLDAFLFLCFGFAIVVSYRQIVGKRDGQRD
jgi:hypothetical protein